LSAPCPRLVRAGGSFHLVPQPSSVGVGTRSLGGPGKLGERPPLDPAHAVHAEPEALGDVDGPLWLVPIEPEPRRQYLTLPLGQARQQGAERRPRQAHRAQEVGLQFLEALTDPRTGEWRKGLPLFGIELPDGTKQTDVPFLDQVGEIEAIDPERACLGNDHRGIALEQRLAGARVARLRSAHQLLVGRLGVGLATHRSGHELARA
jgi:hypothetical protein